MILLLLACGSEPEVVVAPPEPTGPADIVLLVAPGLRADTDAPFAEAALYEALGQQPALRFTAAYAQSCSPYTSLGSMLAGNYPSAIPLCAMAGGNAASPDTTERPWCATVPEEAWTLPRVVNAYGYATGAYVADVDGESPTDWDDLVETAGAWWEASAGMPRLYLVVTSDAHFVQFTDVAGYEEHAPGHERRTVEDSQAVRAAYLAAARETGEGYRRLLDAMPAGDAERWVLMTSTNGLSLAEESGVASNHLKAVTHSIIVDRTVHVPLAVLEPAQDVAVVDEVVELIDVLPTVAELAGAVPPAGLPGRSLLSEPEPDGVAYSEFGDMLSMRQGDLLLTLRFFLHNASSLDPRITEGLKNAGPNHLKLHDVVQDPMQESDLDSREDLQRLHTRLIELREGPASPPMDKETVERLQAHRLDASEGYW
ncbi:MAG: sulfatase-like hydrolase/transferase [Proteobacteria bacterium]|nr:sulfatase-like hydrolase/transferase [Pseudomonadota bacterium]